VRASAIRSDCPKASVSAVAEARSKDRKDQKPEDCAECAFQPCDQNALIGQIGRDKSRSRNKVFSLGSGRGAPKSQIVMMQSRLLAERVVGPIYLAWAAAKVKPGGRVKSHSFFRIPREPTGGFPRLHRKRRKACA